MWTNPSGLSSPSLTPEPRSEGAHPHCPKTGLAKRPELSEGTYTPVDIFGSEAALMAAFGVLGYVFPSAAPRRMG
jgi:hypothetical protein